MADSVEAIYSVRLVGQIRQRESDLRGISYVEGPQIDTRGINLNSRGDQPVPRPRQENNRANGESRHRDDGDPRSRETRWRAPPVVRVSPLGLCETLTRR